VIALALLGGTPLISAGVATRWPMLTPADEAALRRVLERGVLSGLAAPEMLALQAEFAALTGVRYCLATNSGTAALHIALAAAGVRAGDEVIVPALSFIATAQAVLHQGGTPVFADVEAETYAIDPKHVAGLLTSRTRAIVAVHLHGLPADMEALGHVTPEGVTLIEDAAQAHGATYHDRPVGALGAMAAFSLNSTKNLPAGEGGLFVTDSPDLRERAARVRFDGLDPDPGYDPARPLDAEADSLSTSTGWMYLPGELTSAIARAQLSRLPTTTARSQRNAARLTARLSALAGLCPPVVPPDRTHVFHKYRVRLDPGALGLDVAPAALRDLVLRALRAEGVEAGLWQTAPLPAHPLFARPEPYPVSSAALESSLIVGSQSYPLFAQPASVVDRWADAFEKIWRVLPDLAHRRMASS
jgi:dTDP-4-amino-4,6-dideoxygalactose transaminase